MNFENALKIIDSNNITKKIEFDNINNFKTIYDIISNYEIQRYSYNECIIDPDKRLEFLVRAVEIALTNKDMDQNTVKIIIQMFDGIYNYLYYGSDLKEIEIPFELKDNLFNRMHIPNYSQLVFITKLLKGNKKIFDSEFDGKDFSQTISQGLHTNITKVLRLERKNLPHLLGVTNDGSLYEFYRKSYINSKILEILESFEIKDPNNKNFNMEEFNKKFKDLFGLDYSKDNYIKLINWRYNATNDYLRKKGIVVTDEEKEILNKTCDYMPKTQTLDFLCANGTLDLLTQENSKISDFVYSYIRKLIIGKLKTKDVSNSLKEIFNENELNCLLDTKINSNKDIIRDLIDKYVECTKYKIEEDQNFKNNFISNFGYSYPLINYNELLTKNISFYNFSLFKNINSIIVDYNSVGKKIKSEVFLVSYAKDKLNIVKEKIITSIFKKHKIEENKLYDEKQSNDYSMAMKSLLNTPIEESEIYEEILDNDYIMNLKSILNFPYKERYYFRFGFLSKEIRRQNDKMIEDNAPLDDNITLIGFTSVSEDEKNRMQNLETGEMNGIEHYLTCETNITSNYYRYATDYTRNGVEYPIDILFEGKDIKSKDTKILKMTDSLRKLKYYIELLNNIHYSENLSYEELIKYENYLIDNISKMIFFCKTLTELKIKTLKYKLDMNFYTPSEIIDKLKKEKHQLGIWNEYYEKTNNYFLNYKNYIDIESEKNHIKRR